MIAILGASAILLGFWFALHASNLLSAVAGGGALCVLGLGMLADAVEKRRRR
jgi:hypothetical protein